MKLRMARAMALLVTVAGLGLVGAACGAGYSEEDASVFCDQEQHGLGASCFTEGTYDQCKSCYLDCGSDCTRSDSCEYICPE